MRMMNSTSPASVCSNNRSSGQNAPHWLIRPRVERWGRRWLLGSLLLLLWVSVTGAAVFPAKVGVDQRSLVDQNNEPIFIHADAAWSLVVALTREEAEVYLEDRRQKKFNALKVNLIEHKFDGGSNLSGPPYNRYGEAPFTVPGDLATPNEAYFAHADWVIDRAAEKGILLLLTPCYLGYPGTDAGWYEEVLAAGASASRDYGRWLGARYKDKANIIWMMGGDRNPDAALPMVDAMALGIKERDPNHLFTAHTLRENTARGQYPDATWLSFDTVYPLPHLIYGPCLEAYAVTPPMPVIMIEGWYENEHDMTRLDLRRQAYWSVLSGCAGHSFGNRPVWLFDPGWETALDGDGSQDMVHVRALMESRAWSLLEPDTTEAVVAAESVSGLSHVSAGLTADQGTVIAYIPAGTTVTADLSKIKGTRVRAWWYDPRTGTSTSEGSFDSAGLRLFTPPDSQDWVLVIDDRDLGFGPPGAMPLSALPPDPPTNLRVESE